MVPWIRSNPRLSTPGWSRSAVAQRLDLARTVKAADLKRAAGLVHPITLSSNPFGRFSLDRRVEPEPLAGFWIQAIIGKVPRWVNTMHECFGPSPILGAVLYAAAASYLIGASGSSRNL